MKFSFIDLVSLLQKNRNAFLLPILCAFIYLPSVRCTCADDEFKCNLGNVECVSNSSRFDRIPDCEDGSDEAPYNVSSIPTCRATSRDVDIGGGESITLRILYYPCWDSEPICIVEDHFNDGTKSCPGANDISDEAKWVGSNCIAAGGCCPCSDYISGTGFVDCVNPDNDGIGTCECRSGSMQTGTHTCKLRELGDPCSIDSDCYDAVDNTACKSLTCDCANGYYQDPNGTYCIARIIGDQCTVDVDCDAIIDNSNCTNNMCYCDSGYYSTNSNTTCTKRMIGDNCGLQTDCSAAIVNSECSNETLNCQCQFLYITNAGCTDEKQDTVQSGSAVPSGFSATLNGAAGGSDFAADTSIAIPAAGGITVTSTDSGVVYMTLVSLRFTVTGATAVTLDVTTADGNSQFTLDTPNGVYYSAGEAVTNSSSGSSAPLTTHLEGKSISSLQISVTDDGTGNAILGNIMLSVTRCLSVQTEGTACVERTIDDSCTADSQCLLNVSNSHCEANECQCNTGYYQANSGTTCVLSEIGDECLTDAHCDAAVNNSNCDDTYQCTCNEGFYPSDDQTSCILRTITDNCTRDVDCSAAVPFSLCSNGTLKCDCVSGYRISADLTQCILRTVEDNCTMVADCADAVGNSTCVNDKCACDTGFKATSNKTECNLLTIEDPCETTLQCSTAVTNSQCNNATNSCQCEIEYKSNGGGTTCDLIEVGVTTCEAGGSLCSDAISNSECDNTTLMCTCQPGHNIDNTTTCTKRKIDDSTCSENSDCSAAVTNSICCNGTCKCGIGYVTSADLTQCELLQIGSVCSSPSCSTNDECAAAVGNSTCSGDTCKCLDGFKASEDAASCTIRTLTDNCTVNVDCSAAVPNSECGGVTNNSCVCSMGYEQGSSAGTECNELKPGSTCDGDSQCVAAMVNSHCNNTNVCECDTGYAYSNATTSCDQNNVGAPCSTNQDCSTVNQTECNSTTSTCDCMAGYTQNPDGTDCHQRVLEKDTCTTDSECSYDVSNSLCGVSGTCECKTGYDVSATKTACQLHSVNYTKCNNSRSSNSNTDCQFIQNSHCSNETQLCECQLGFTPDREGTMCRESELGDPCTGQEACTVFIGNSTCASTTKQCVCLPGFKTVTTTTYNSTTNSSTDIAECIKRQLGEECTSDTDCSTAVPNSTCTERETKQHTSQTINVCGCTQGHEPAISNTSCDCLFTYNNQCLPVKINSTSCTSDSMCATFVANSECSSNGVCTCKSGFVSVNGGSVCMDRVLGSSCDIDSDCSAKLNNTGCFNGICDCVSGFVSDDDQASCIASTTPDTGAITSPECEGFVDCNVWAVILIAIVLAALILAGVVLLVKIYFGGLKRVGTPPTTKYGHVRPIMRAASKVGVMYSSPDLREPDDIDGLMMNDASRLSLGTPNASIGGVDDMFTVTKVGS